MLIYLLGVVFLSLKLQAAKIEQPLVSVIVPVYNTKGDFFVSCIDNLLTQPYQNIEIIIVNDGSSAEHISSILANYEEQFPSKVTVIRLETNLG